MHEERQVQKYVNERQFHNSQNVTATRSVFQQFDSFLKCRRPNEKQEAKHKTCLYTDHAYYKSAGDLSPISA